MSIKRRLISVLYPLIKTLAKNKKNSLENQGEILPLNPLYDLTAIKADGSIFSFESLKGKKILIVNTASDCGFTPQYKELESLYKRTPGLIILGFPSNDFKGQEPGSDKEIAEFCELNYKISFPIFKKDSVLNPQYQQVYKWLTDQAMNGWNQAPPTWNFCKYLINEQGILKSFHGPQTAPSEIDLNK